MHCFPAALLIQSLFPFRIMCQLLPQHLCLHHQHSHQQTPKTQWSLPPCQQLQRQTPPPANLLHQQALPLQHLLCLFLKITAIGKVPFLPLIALNHRPIRPKSSTLEGSSTVSSMMAGKMTFLQITANPMIMSILPS